MHYSCPS